MKSAQRPLEALELQPWQREVVDRVAGRRGHELVIRTPRRVDTDCQCYGVGCEWCALGVTTIASRDQADRVYAAARRLVEGGP